MVAIDSLRIYLPIDRCHALAQGVAIPDRVQGAALFADISGFTPLTGALAAELGRQRGAEVVLDYINPIYEALVGKLHEYRGSVIGFAGDSITCWLDGDDGRRAVASSQTPWRISRAPSPLISARAVLGNCNTLPKGIGTEKPPLPSFR